MAPAGTGNKDGELESHRISFCTRWFCESATYKFPVESRATPQGLLNCPGRRAAGRRMNLQRLIIGVEHLDAAVANSQTYCRPAHPRRYHRGILNSPLPLPPCHGTQQLAVTRKDLNAVVAGIGHVDAVLRVRAESLGAVQFPGPGSGVAEAAQEFRAGGVARAGTWHAGRANLCTRSSPAIFADVDFALRVHRDRPGSVNSAALVPRFPHCAAQLAVGEKMFTR